MNTGGTRRKCLPGTHRFRGAY